MANSTRILRVGDQIQRIVSELLQREIQDPRLRMITISSVEVSSDLSFAKIYFTFIEGECALEDILKGLKKAKGFIRHKMGSQLNARIVPEIHFIHDQKMAKANHLSDLIDSAVTQDAIKRNRETGTE